MSNRAIVVGAGIVGLAVARVLRLRGFQVTILEKSEKAVGASIRNFGMIWPIGQPEGELYQMAIRSRDIWQEIADSTDLWHKATGSLHVAYFEDEWLVLQELFDIFSKQGRKVTLLNKDTIAQKFPAVNQLNLLGGLFSAEELIVNPRTAIPNIATYLQEFLM